MSKGLLFGAVVIGGVAVGFVVYTVVEKKGPQLLAAAKKKASRLRENTCSVVAEAAQAFREGYVGAQA